MPSPRRPRRLTRQLGVLASAATLVAALGTPAAQALPAPHQGWASTQRPATTRDVTLPGGDRIHVTTLAGGATATVLDPAPRANGTVPSFLVGEGSQGTTIQASDASPATAPTSVPLGSATARKKAPAVPAAAPLVDLHLDAIARDGRTGTGTAVVFDVVTGAVQATRPLPGDPSLPCSPAPYSQSPCLQLPAGTYSVMGFIYTMPADKPSTSSGRTVLNTSLVGDPEMRIDAETHYTLDARRATEVTVSTPEHRTRANDGGAMQIGMHRVAANGVAITEQLHESPGTQLQQRFFLQPTKPVHVGTLDAFTRWRLETPAIEMSVPGLGALQPEYYDKVWFSDTASQYPFFDGHAQLRVVDVGTGTPAEIARANLRGALAVIERSAAIPVADQSNAAAAAGARMVAIYNDGPGVNSDPGKVGIQLHIPTVRLSHDEGVALLWQAHRRHLPVSVRGETASPYLYDLVYAEHQQIPRQLHYVARTRTLASVTRHFDGQPSIDSTFSEASYEFQPFDDFSITTLLPLQGGPRTRTDYHVSDPNTRWSFAVLTPESKYNHIFSDPPVDAMALSTNDTVTYRPGEHTADTWGSAPVTPGISQREPLERSGDRMRVHVTGFVDASGHSGDAATSAFPGGLRTDFALYAGSTLLAETTHLPAGVISVPTDDSTYRMTFEQDNPQSWTQLSTHTEAEWTWRSSHVAVGSSAVEPLIVADYDVSTDLHNRVAAARGRHRVTVGLNLGHQAGAAASTITGATVAASYDDGATWAPAEVHRTQSGRYQVSLPAGHGFVSLRLTAADSAGGTLRQEVTRAFYIGSGH